MSRGLRETARRLVPAIAWRDEKLAERADEIRRLQKELKRARTAPEPARLREDLTEVRASLARLSFTRSLDDLRRSVVLLRRVDPTKAHPLRQLPFKLRNYRLAASHGIAVPEIYGVWSTVDAIDLSSLPDSFVLKSDGGAGGHGVLPLRRRAGDAFELISTDTVLTAEELRTRLTSAKSLSGPYFAEELLRGTGGSTTIPDDIKLFGFYGGVGQVLLRRVDEHGNLNKTFYRFVDDRGEDLGDGVWDRRLDGSIPLPSSFATMVETARHLSRAVGVPFVRVDLYETDRGVVLGELTRVPGGSPRYSPAHDETMGRMFEEARWQLERDVVGGRPPGILHGPYEAPNPYPADHVSQRPDPGTWAITRGHCEWCAGESA